MFNTSRFKGLVLTAALFGAAGTARAGSTDNLPGAACTAVTAGALTVRDDGEAENRTAAVVTAICPAERPIGAGLATSLGGRVFVVDQSHAGDVCCRAVSKNPGGAKTAGAWQCSSGNGAGFQILDLAPITDGHTWSSFYLECQVPAMEGDFASRIQTYRTIQK